MSKLQLRVDALEVASFPTDATGADARGTVEAFEAMSRVTCTRHTDPCLCLQPPTTG